MRRGAAFTRRVGLRRTRLLGRLPTRCGRFGSGRLVRVRARRIGEAARTCFVGGTWRAGLAVAAGVRFAVGFRGPRRRWRGCSRLSRRSWAGRVGRTGGRRWTGRRGRFIAALPTRRRKDANHTAALGALDNLANQRSLADGQPRLAGLANDGEQTHRDWLAVEVPTVPGAVSGDPSGRFKRHASLMVVAVPAG